MPTPPHPTPAAGLASPAGPEGLHIAHAWLAEIIVHLSRQLEQARAKRPASAKQQTQVGAPGLRGVEIVMSAPFPSALFSARAAAAPLQEIARPAAF